MAKALDTIKSPIKAELKTFEHHFRESMKSQVPLLDKITYYIVQRKGKQIRPIFVFLSAKIFGQVNEASNVAASMIELIHTATLVHDDVVDDSNKRRGFFSVNALWKNKIAVLVGDFLFCKGTILAAEKEEFEIFKIICRAVKETSEGELLQMDKARKLDITEEVYFKIIEQKTASLISASCSAGAYSTTKDRAIADTMWEFGRQLGLAYQIKDDIFDYGGEDVGKPLGIDIKEKKMTLPLIHVMNKSDRKTKKWMRKIVSKHNENKKKVQELITFVRDNGGIDYAVQKMHEHKENALKILDQQPASDSKDAMIKLVHFIVERKK